jgi:hypothetical protein
MTEQADVMVKEKPKTPETTESSRGMRRLTLEFSDQSYNLLEALSKEMGNSKKEAIRKALSLLKIAIEEQKQGSTLEFANKKKDYRKEVALLF